MWWSIALYIATLALAYVFRPKLEIKKPEAVEEFDIPVAEDGKVIPVLFGTRNTEDFNVVWWGDTGSRSFQVSGGESTWLVDIEDVHGGYHYWVGIHAVLFHGPIDNISQVITDDKLAWSGENTGGAICFDRETKDIYGGDEAGGGFGWKTLGEGQAWATDGCIEILMGEPTQGVNWYLSHNLDGGDAVGDTGAHEVPAFRGVVSAVLNRVYIGTNPSLRKLGFRGQRVYTRQSTGEDQWYSEKAGIQFACGASAQETPSQKVAIYIAVDESNSISNNCGSSAVTIRAQGASRFLDYIADNILDTHTVDIRGVRFHGTRSMATTTPNWDGVDNPTSVDQTGFSSTANPLTITDASEASDLTAMYTCLDETNVWYGTDFALGMSLAADFFSGMDDNVIKVVMLISDGLNNPWNCWDYGGILYQYICGSVARPDISLSNAQSAYASIDDTIVNLSRYGFGSAAPTTTYIDAATGHTASNFTSGTDLGDAMIAALDEAMTSSDNPVDMNPAHLIRECLTDPDWGMSSSDPDETSFVAAADTLHTEGLGISIKWSAQTSIEDFIDLIKKHINAELYPDHTTGKQVLTLIREDYNVEDLLVLGEDEIVRVESAKRPLIGELINSVTVQYWDSCLNEDASITVTDQALVDVQGGTINTTIQYPGITNKRNASLVATRDLRTLSAQLLTCTLYVNRTAEDLNLGSVFVLYWPDLEISGVVMRVQGIDFGDGRSNTIRLDVVEDVFGLPATVVVYDDDDDPTWTNPVQPPEAVTYQNTVEASYHELLQRFGATNLTAALTANSDLGYTLTSAVRPGNAINAQHWTDDGGGYRNSGNLQFSGTAVLDVAVDQTDTVWSYGSSTDIDLFTAGSYALIDDELVIIESVDTTAETITVGRGTIDTSPRSHAIDARLIGIGAYNGMDLREYDDGDSIDAKVLPATGLGVLDIDDATADTVTMDSRALRPYPPADLQIDAVSYPAIVSTLSPEVTWAQRNRLTQTSLLDHTDASVTDESNNTYTIYVIDSTPTTQITHTGETGTSKTLDMTGLPNDNYTLQVWSTRNSNLSWQCAESEFSYVIPSSGTAAATMGAFTGDGVGLPVLYGTAAATMGAFTGDATNAVNITGTGAAVMGAFTGSAESDPAYEYWRIYVTENNGAAYTNIEEVQMFVQGSGTDECTGGTATADSELSATFSAAKAFDGTTAYWHSTSDAPNWIQYQHSTAKKIKKISMKPEEGRTTYMPVDFNIQGSDNGVDYDTIWSVTGFTGWAESTEESFPNPSADVEFTGTIPDLEFATDEVVSQDMSDYFSDWGTPTGYSLSNEPTWLSINNSGVISGTAPSSSESNANVTITATNSGSNATSNTFDIDVSELTSATYWQIYITGPNNYGVIGEIEMRATIGGADQCSGGTASASSTYPGYPASNAFDNSGSSTFWHSNSGGQPHWIRYQFASSTVVQQLSITSSNRSADNGRAPTDFVLQSSNNGTDWTTELTVSGGSTWSTSETRTFS